MFGDGREERLAATTLAIKLSNDPRVTARRLEYFRCVRESRSEANGMTDKQVIDRLTAHNPAYIRELLESEDERFGKGALRERYARTFFKDWERSNA